MYRLKELRKNRNITQKELANTFHIAQSTLSGWENEKFEIDNKNLIKLAKYFNVSADYILGTSDIKKARQIESKDIDDHEIKFALFGTTEIDDETYESVKNFAKFAAAQKRKKRESK